MQAQTSNDSSRTGNGHGTTSLAVVVVTYNSSQVLGALLDSLPGGLAGISKTEVVIVDNNSNDCSVEIALAHRVKARVIQMGRNAGYAAAINAAEATIDGESPILILNPDTRILPGCGLCLVNRMAESSVGLVVPRLINEDGSVANSLRREPSIGTSWSDSLLGTTLAGRLGVGEIVIDPVLYEGGGIVDWATGAALAIPARARKAVGRWDESFFLYSEEVDYMQRVRAKGMKVVYEANAQAVHIGGEYHENTHLSALMTSNRIVYFRRHHGPIATWMFRLGIIIGGVIRLALGPGHRAALRAALRPELEYRAALQG